jgi:hypothetical protein
MLFSRVSGSRRPSRAYEGLAVGHSCGSRTWGLTRQTPASGLTLLLLPGLPPPPLVSSSQVRASVAQTTSST